MALRVLIVDDDPLARMLLGKALEGLGHTVLQHDTAFGTTGLIQTAKPDVVVIDVNLPGLKGPQLIEVASRRAGSEGGPIFLLYSGMDEMELRDLAGKVGAAGALPKSLTPRALATEFERIVSAAGAGQAAR